MKPTTEIVMTHGDGQVDRPDELIRAQDYPLNGEARAAMHDFIASNADMIAHAVVRGKRHDLEAAKALWKQCESQRTSHMPRAAEAEAAYSRTVPGSLGCAILLTPFAIACLAMEFVISWTALSWLFGIDRRSLLGVMVGVGPTAALAILKIVFARLFEQRYQDLRAGVLQSTRARILAGVSMALVLTAVALFNIYTVMVQARLREEISIVVRDALENDDVTTFAPIDSEEAVVATSVAVSINGAILFVIAWNEAFNWRRRRSAKQRADAERAALRVLESAAANAEATVAALSQEDVERTAREAAERRRAELLLLCHSEASRQAQARTATESVGRSLRRMADVARAQMRPA